MILDSYSENSNSNKIRFMTFYFGLFFFLIDLIFWFYDLSNGHSLRAVNIVLASLFLLIALYLIFSFINYQTKKLIIKDNKLISKTLFSTKTLNLKDSKINISYKKSKLLGEELVISSNNFSYNYLIKKETYENSLSVFKNSIGNKLIEASAEVTYLN